MRGEGGGEAEKKDMNIKVKNLTNRVVSFETYFVSSFEPSLPLSFGSSFVILTPTHLLYILTQTVH